MTDGYSWPGRIHASFIFLAGVAYRLPDRLQIKVERYALQHFRAQSKGWL
jgi:hypothetical protein